MGPLKLSTSISEKQIQERIRKLGAELTDRFRGKQLTAVCVLNGSFIFFADLIREIEADVVCDFFCVSSYQNTSSTGEVKITLDLTSSVKDKHVLLVEDIVDTGLTMAYLQKNLENRGPRSVTSVALLHKPQAKKVECKLDFVGFEIPNDFVVGYGLDYNGMYRHLPYIAQVSNLN